MPSVCFVDDDREHSILHCDPIARTELKPDNNIIDSMLSNNDNYYCVITLSWNV